MRIAILTSGRQDWGILRSTVEALARSPRMDVVLLWGGTHATDGALEQPSLSGVTFRALDWIGADGAAIDPVAHAARAVGAVGGALALDSPDALLLAGDRFETLGAALAATICRVPIVHLHGGEETHGAIDDAMRHAITKLSHLHLVSEPQHRDRVVAMGEDPATVYVVGAPGLDNAGRDDLPDRAELEATLGIALADPVVIVTVHPTTLAADPALDARAVSAAMDAVPATYVVTLPNLDPDAGEVRSIMEASARHPGRVTVAALGERGYWGLMKIAAAMLGNSSSGLIEAPAVGLPVVNVGARQSGRPRSPGVIDVPAEADAIVDALRRALAARPPAVGRGGPSAASRILAVLESWQPPRPPAKAPIRVGP